MSMLPPADRRPGSRVIPAVVGLIVGTVVAGLLLGLMALPMVGGLGVLTRNAIGDFEGLPDTIDTPPLAQRTEILAADGSSLATIYAQNRAEVPLASIAPIMRQAQVAIEDSRFLEHNGVDTKSVLRAAARNAGSGQVRQGASTLTMQYVENVLVNSAATQDELDAAHGQSAAGKLREARYALALERRYTKAEILERYLNIVYYGSGAYGVEAAAHRFFDTSAAELTLPQAATLAGLVQSPINYDPLRHPDAAQKRRDIVLTRMAQLGYITPRQESAAKAIPMSTLLKPTTMTNGCTTSYAPFFCDYVIRTIRTDETFGKTPQEREAFLKRGGYTIKTTLDPKAQRGAFDAVTATIPIDDESRRAAAITMIQPGTGNVVAMTQNRIWGTNGKGTTTYNYNVDRSMGGTIGMQAGSTFKAFTLAAALEAGIAPTEYISSPSPKTFTGFVNCETGVPFPPVTVRNSTSSGTFDMARGTAYSVNTFFMGLEERTGLCRPAEIAESMGVFRGNGEALPRVPSFTLGSLEVTPLQMANAYATFANHGSYCKPRSILEIRDRNGHSLPVPPVDCHQVISRSVADGTTAILTGVVDGGIPGRTGARMALADRRPAAGKTGTTNDSAAVWFLGFTPDLAAAVWVGDPRGGYAHPMKAVTVNGKYYDQVFGGTLPGPIWKASMDAALQGTPTTQFQLVNQWGLKAANVAPLYAAPKPKPVDVMEFGPGTDTSTAPTEPAVPTDGGSAAPVEPPVSSDDQAPPQ